MDDFEAQDMPVEMTPDELEAQIRAEREAMLAKLEMFGQTISKKRDEAVSGRKSSGIEQEWYEAEEQYQGIDDANRGESTGAFKPSELGGSFIGRPERKDVRSTVFLNITRPYVDAASAKVADMLLPTDDRNWGIKPTPNPALQQIVEQQPQMQQMQQPQQMPQMGMPGMEQMPQMGMPPQMHAPVDQAKQIMQDASKRAEAAERRIEDWMVECQYHAEVRKVIEDCAKLGTGVLKGPFPQKKRSRLTMQDGLVMEIRYDPASRRISPWNFYPDPCAGENIQNGQYVFEKDEMTVKQVRDLIGVPGYLDDQIEAVLEEGPGKKYEGVAKSGQRTYLTDNEKYEVWYYHGLVDAKDLECAGLEIDAEDGVYAIITLINDRVIKAALEPLDNGEYPYDVMPWQRKPDMPWGTGICQQIRTPQRMANASVRNMMDNAGISAGGQFVMRRGAVEPADGTWGIVPRKIWFVKDDADTRSVNDVFASIQLPSMQADLMNITQFALKIAEDVTGMPMLLQGQQGQAPDTVGGMNIIQNNASSVLRRIARTFDDCITEPHVRRYYQWLLEYGEDDDEKGDFQIDARGSTALVERDIANQAIMNLGQFVMNPAFGLSPAKWIEELLKSQRIDPKRLQLDEEEKQAMAQQQQPPAPQIAAAQIRAEAELKKEEMRSQVALQKVQMDTDRDTVHVQEQKERTALMTELKMQELALRRELALLEYANRHQLTIEQLKTDLARDAAKINLQRELAQADNVAEAAQVLPAPVEPPGRAPDGMAYQR